MDTPRIPDEIFKAYDIRGIVGRSLTPQLVYFIGKALGSEVLAAGDTRIAVGRDGRLSGPALSEALIQGLISTGCQVEEIGLVPTGALYFAIEHLGTGSGVIVTGSHNPPDYNGFKMVIAGRTLAGEDIQRLKRRIETGELSEGSGRREKRDILEAYLERIANDIHLARPLKVVVDCGNGAAAAAAPELFRRLGCELDCLYCEVDGRFPHHHPDPSQPENLQDLIQRVRERGADIGLAFDGDGDRVGVIAPDGEIIWPDRQMILYARDVLSRHPGAEIIYDIKCSTHLGRAIEAAGGKPLMWKTGHSLIKAKLKETGAPLAGEMSGHIFFKDRWYGFDDGLYAAARLLEILARDPRPTLEVFAELPDMVNTPELRLELPEGSQHAFMERLLAEAHFPDGQLTTIDGLRVDFDDGWGLVRASNTTPCLVIRFEGRDQATLEHIQERFRALFQRLDPQLQLPF